MISIHIGQDERAFDHADTQWIHEQFNNRLAGGGRPCIRVGIAIPDAEFDLITPECGGGSGDKVLSPLETRILEIWRRHRLNTREYNSGQIIAFLNELRQFR
jgi:hypothetical protein